MESSRNSIEVKDLTKVYGRNKAIDGLSFDVGRGNVVGFLGPNGAGKSTTMRILTGLMSATSGFAYVEGISVANDPQKVKGLIGYMPENNPLPEDMRVGEYLKLRARLKDVASRDIKFKIGEVLELCDLGRSVERKMIGTLSKGYRQRVGIADCLVGSPKVIIMDEPTIGLDPHQVLGMRHLLKLLKGQLTVIVSSHILSEIDTVCDRSIIINQGQIVAQGTNGELKEKFAPGKRFRVEVKTSVEVLKSLLSCVDSEVEILEESMVSSEFISVMFRTFDESLQGECFMAKLVESLGSESIRGFHCVEASLEEIFIAATSPSWNVLTELPLRKRIA